MYRTKETNIDKQKDNSKYVGKSDGLKKGDRMGIIGTMLTANA